MLRSILKLAPKITFVRFIVVYGIALLLAAAVSIYTAFAPLPQVINQYHPSGWILVILRRWPWGFFVGALPLLVRLTRFVHRHGVKMDSSEPSSTPRATASRRLSSVRTGYSPIPPTEGMTNSQFYSWLESNAWRTYRDAQERRKTREKVERPGSEHIIG